MVSTEENFENLIGCSLGTISSDSIAVVIGCSGGIGAGLLKKLIELGHFKQVIGLSRDSNPPMELTNEESLERAAQTIAQLGDLRVVIDATGFLHDSEQSPEKTWRQLSAQNLGKSFAVNVIGPALLMKYFLPKLPRSGKSVFATLSARVGSIGDNHLGGWYAYRASKAALNQIVRTASIELSRTSPEAVCIALHPGTVNTQLSAPFLHARSIASSPEATAAHLLNVLDRLNQNDNGGFFDWRGAPVPW